MTRRFGSAALSCSVLWGMLWAAGAAAAEQPNFVFIFADDQCYKTIASLGNEEIETPNLDALAARGVSFTNAYNMGGWNGAICVASRTMLNTGRQLWNAHAINRTLKQERESGRFWSDQLRAAGYRTYMTGKWHVSTPAAEAFDVVGHVRGGMPKQTPKGYNRPSPGVPDPWSPSDPTFGGFWEGGKHWSEVVADDAQQFVEDARQHDQPFFMYLAFNAPHDPRQAPDEFVRRYPAESILVPASYQPLYPFRNEIGCSASLRDERLAPFPRTEYAVQVHRQEYYAIITHMDAQIGRIVEAVDALGKKDNTYFVFTADHGLAVGHHGLIGKQNMYDHSVRVPFMICGPDIPANETRRAPIYLQDVMPTTLELAGIDTPDFVEFKSVLPHVRNDDDAVERDAIYGGYIDLQRMIVMDGYKLILYPKANAARLYHVASDPEELYDLAAEPHSDVIIRRLMHRLFDLQRENGDQLDLRKAFSHLL